MKNTINSITGTQPGAFMGMPKAGNGSTNASVSRTFTISGGHEKTISPKPVQEVIHEWVMDKDNSSLEFSTGYMNVVNVIGRFNDFDVKVKSKADDFTDAYIFLSARVNSLDTGNVRRDAALKGADWLNIDKFPAITFNSTSLKKAEGENYELTGNLTLNGVSHTVSFDVVFNGMFTNRDPKVTIAGFTVHGSIDRSKFDLGGNDVATEVGYIVCFNANIQLKKG